MIDSKNGIIGLAIGDALGVPGEFKSREYLKMDPITTMTGYGTHNMPEGTWSDDTSMTLATIDSIIDTNGINPNDIANKFVDWWKDSKYTPAGETFDIGSTCQEAIYNYYRDREKQGAVNATRYGRSGEFNNGNGALMRILPIAYYCNKYTSDNMEILENVRIVSSITHGHEISLMGCYMYVLFAIKLLNGYTKEDAFKSIMGEDYSMFEEATRNKYHKIINGDLLFMQEDAINSSGYVVDTLEAALWCLMKTKTYEDAVIRAVNLGSDTDTVGACTGGLAGILYGLKTIKDEWKFKLVNIEYIENLCNEFNEMI